MINEEALQDFLRSLRLAIKSASLYPPEHPAFRKNAEQLKEKADILLQSHPALKIGFTPHSLVVDGKTWEKDKIWEELAFLFHARLILNLEIKPGISADDWLKLTQLLSLTPREIVRAGGIRFLLAKEKIPAFSIEELDYSELLSAEGVEIKDIWRHLLSEVVHDPSQQKIRRAAEIFPRVLAQLNIKELLAKRDPGEGVGHFLSLLKEKNETEFLACAVTMIRKILKEKLVPSEDEQDQLSGIIAQLEDQDLARLLLDEMSRAERFEASTAEIFFRLVGSERAKRIARGFEEEALRKSTELSESVRFKEVIQAILAAPPPFSPTLSPFREVLTQVLDQIFIRKRPGLDRGHLSLSYRSMLLNILGGEASQEAVSLSLAAILEEWEKISQDNDFAFLRLLFETLEKKADTLAEDPLFSKIRAELADLIEKSILAGEVRPELEYLLSWLPRSRLGVNYYLATIFDEHKITPAILRTFFHLFADEIFYFYLSLDQNKSNRRFLLRMIASLAEVDSPLSLATLKHIFSFGDSFLRVKSLEAMGRLSTYDEKFLYPLLRQADLPQKKKALLILKREPETRQKALRILLLRPSPFGLRNRMLLHHLRVIEDLDLREAAEHIARLGQRRFFWNKKLRREAGNLLRKWSLGQG